MIKSLKVTYNYYMSVVGDESTDYSWVVPDLLGVFPGARLTLWLWVELFVAMIPAGIIVTDCPTNKPEV